jgi:3-dehydroquinate synthase
LRRSDTKDHPITGSPGHPISLIIYDFRHVKKIPVRLKQNTYQVLIGSGLLRRAGSELHHLLPTKSSRAFVITSANVRRHWGAVLEESLEKAHVPYAVLEMDDGEPAKHMHTVEQLAEQMVDARADRKALIVAFGGGVVGDAAGFLAAIFMRGIPVVQIPTTFLAQVDASIGGKTGVNLRAGKNLVGAFHQPRAVLIDPEVVATLNDREFRAGLFESLKCGVIRDKALFEFMTKKTEAILRRDRKALERIILDSVRVKAAVVAADEKESDLRRILNFGHTVGHALESATRYGHFLHGEAVGWGMIAASSIARDAGVCDDETATRIRSAVLAYGPLPPVPCSADDVLTRLSADKKTVGGSVHFVLPRKVGKVIITDNVPVQVVRNAVEQLRNHA